MLHWRELLTVLYILWKWQEQFFIFTSDVHSVTGFRWIGACSGVTLMVSNINLISVGLHMNLAAPETCSIRIFLAKFKCFLEKLQVLAFQLKSHQNSQNSCCWTVSFLSSLTGVLREVWAFQGCSPRKTSLTGSKLGTLGFLMSPDITSSPSQGSIALPGSFETLFFMLAWNKTEFQNITSSVTWTSFSLPRCSTYI